MSSSVLLLSIAIAILFAPERTFPLRNEQPLGRRLFPYRAQRVLQRILRTKQLVVQDAETIWKAVRLFEASRADFADCLIERTGATHECEYTSTFDKHATSRGMRLIE